MSPPAAIIGRGRAAGLLLLFLLYLGAPLAHALHHARESHPYADDFDTAVHLATPATGHHAGDCPLCQTFLHAAPVLTEAGDSPAATPAVAMATAPSTPLARLPPSVCWSSSRGPPRA